jgi:hypothetical protein
MRSDDVTRMRRDPRPENRDDDGKDDDDEPDQRRDIAREFPHHQQAGCASGAAGPLFFGPAPFAFGKG